MKLIPQFLLNSRHVLPPFREVSLNVLSQLCLQLLLLIFGAIKIVLIIDIELFDILDKN